MRKSILLATMTLVIGLFAVGMARAEENIPSLLGTWEILTEGLHQHSSETGHKAIYERILIVVEGQEGRAFFGHKEKFIDKKMVQNEKFSGVVYWDNKTIYVVDHDKGFNHATIESPTEIRGVHMEEGIKARIVLLIWKKIK
ncbi:MAG: hypothetical protein FP816_14740 [Desulfobacteraceae bacterium]|nr:hypothetical protein [Desulfobacteraceae bacterium]